MKKRNPRIALAPIRYFDISKTDNLEKIKKYIGLAKKAKADIVCFPESTIHKNKILDLNGKYIRQIREECGKNSIWCIVTEDMNFNGKSHNIALLINRKGEIAGNYKKIHLYGDADELKSGQKIGVFKTDFAKIGIVICWDLAYPELFKKMKKAGAQIVFCPAEWCYEEKAHDKEHKKREMEILKSLVKARAFENLFFVALCNPLHDRKDLVSYSAIASPHKILKESADSEKLLISEINLKEISKFKKIYPF
ncbi:carbon-nitrogen hydrolase family protein [Candidatus Pacearchaeota archaeon]|nr:carbon-nitrogen hydrolase family protein [Candidatus Pacearchaeota archaeon]